MEVSVALFSKLQADLQAHGDFRDPEASPQAFAKEALLQTILKKNADEVADNSDAKCLEKFLSSNLACSRWELKCCHSGDELLVGLFKERLYRFLNPRGEFLVQSYFDLLDLGRLGPGSSIGANGEDFYTKLFSSKLTATSSWLYEIYNEWCGKNPNWRDAEISRALNHGVFRATTTSSVTFVRKTRDISRSIAAEPILNMFYQLGLAEQLKGRLHQYFGIDLSTQPDRNRELARYGSETDQVSTLDLASASDSMSCRMVREVFPLWFYSILDDLRVPSIRYPGGECELHMISTMGNGYTFPLQTVVFSCVVAAVFDSFDTPLPPASAEASVSKWGVFGDDIVCPKGFTPRVVRLLNLLGFTVNSDKSFSEGPFRESCGHDYFRGVNVRGVYLKSLRTAQSRYVAINQLNDWSARHMVPLPRTIGYLLSTVPGLAIPPYEAEDTGVRVPLSFVETRLWQSKKQRFRYRCFEVVRNVLEIDTAREIVRSRLTRNRRTKRRSFNPSGLWIAFLGGYIRNMRITLPLKQGEVPVYRTRWKIAPFWGPSPDQLSKQGGWGFWMRWNSALETNLVGFEPRA